MWFQNRRTKQKKDQTKDTDKHSSPSSESVATCNILRLLEQGGLLSVPAPPNPLLPPNKATGPLLGGPSSSSPSTTTVGGFGLSLPSLSAPSSLASPLSPHLAASQLCFSVPVLGGGHELPGVYSCGSSAFEPYTRIERKGGNMGGKKTIS